MDVPTLLKAIALRISAVDGVGAAHYPAPDTLNRYPEVVLYWGSDVDTTIEWKGSQGLWLPAIKAQVMGPRTGDSTPKEFAVIDNLLTPIVDAFDTGPDGGGVSRVLPDLPGHVDHVDIVRLRPTLLINYAGHVHYGAELYFSVKMRRARS